MFKKSKDVLGLLVGLAMLIVGGYFFLQNVGVSASNIFQFSIAGRRMDGLLFVPLIASIIFLFYKYCLASKICFGLSLLIIIANVIMNLRIFWYGSSLFSIIIIFVLMFGGIGILARVLFANPEGKHGKDYKKED